MITKAIKKMKEDSTIRTILDIGLFFYFILNQLHYIFAFTGVMQFLVVASINAIGLITLIVTMLKKMDKKILIITILLVSFGLLSFFFTQNFGLITYMTILRYLGIVMYLLHYRQDTKMTSLIMYTTLALFIPVIIEDLGYNMFLKASRNYYSIILLMPNFVFNKSYWDLNKKAPVFPTIAATFICIFAGGRGGIISYGLFFVATLLMNFKLMNQKYAISKTTKYDDTKEIPLIREEDLVEEISSSKMSFWDKYKSEIIAVSIMLFAFSSLFALKYIDKKYDIFNFEIPEIINVFEDNVTDTSYGFAEKGIKSKTRLVFIDKYFRYAFSDINYFLNGVKLSIEPFFAKYNFNLHNSFLGLHAKLGIYGIIICGYLGFRALYIMIKKKEWEHLLIYTAILARVFLDTAAFPGQLDIILFYYFFRFYNLKSEYKQRIS